MGGGLKLPMACFAHATPLHYVGNFWPPLLGPSLRKIIGITMQFTLKTSNFQYEFTNKNKMNKSVLQFPIQVTHAIPLHNPRQSGLGMTGVGTLTK